jgi:hypothetical protein
MKFLVDVNAGGGVARWREERGHEVARVADLDPEMGDVAVLEWAVREERIIVTTDQDFEEMTWREGRSYRGLLRLAAKRYDRGIFAGWPRYIFGHLGRRPCYTARRLSSLDPILEVKRWV